MCKFFHKFGNYEVVSQGLVGDKEAKCLTLKNGEHFERTTTTTSGNFIVQKRKCKKCNYIELVRREVY